MNEKNAPASEALMLKKERFEFILTINGNIICQRFFRINGFKRESLSSTDLLHTIGECVEMIEGELKRKSDIYNWITAPQVFEDEKEAKTYLSSHKLSVPTFVIFRNDADNVYVWNGENVEKYENFFRNDYAVGKDEQPNVLKFAFLDGGREVISRIFDGGCYPKFVRTNIDLSNSRNRYRNGDVFAPFEANLIDAMNEGGSDIIPQIVRKLCTCCSYDEKADYDTYDRYSDVEYNLSVDSLNNKMFNKLEKVYRKRTRDYFWRG